MDESPTLFIDERTERLVETVLSDSYELNQFCMSHLSLVEEMCRLIVMHWDKPDVFGHLIKQQVENDVKAECADQAREELA